MGFLKPSHLTDDSSKLINSAKLYNHCFNVEKATLYLHLFDCFTGDCERGNNIILNVLIEGLKMISAHSYFNVQSDD